MLFWQKLQILMAMTIAAVTGGMSLSKEDLIKLDRNVVQMYEMVHTKVINHAVLVIDTKNCFLRSLFLKLIQLDLRVLHIE